MSYRRRLLAAFAYVLVLVILALALPLALSTSRRIDDEVRAQATDAAQLVAASASGRLDRPAELQELVRKVAADVGARVIIVDGRGALLADSAGPAAAGADYAGRPEVAAALAGRTVQGRRRSDTLRTELLYTAVPVVTAGRTTAAVRLTESVGGIDAAIRRDRLVLIGLCGLALALGLTVAAVLARTLARPLHALAGTARRVADGELGARADVGGSSEQQQVALAFNEMADRLTHALAAQKDFVSNASHQLRTPLTGLRLRLEGAGALTDDPAVAAEIEAADAEVVRLARLVANLLELASADAPPPAPGPVDLAAVLAEAEERWQARAAHDRRAVRLADAAPTTACSHGDDVATMLDNLIENALVHSPPGGVVELACGDEDGTAFVAVLDRGPGVTEAEAAAAFERFASGARRPRGAGGTGLGLAIVAALAARSGGSASLANREGGGARAEIRLPLYQALTIRSVR
jgi:signal transduction histidine kinase